jgi:hypothetical protein
MNHTPIRMLCIHISLPGGKRATKLCTKLGLQTVWLAPGVGPVKIETPHGIAELIDYEIK